jgi:hypothetical protein
VPIINPERQPIAVCGLQQPHGGSPEHLEAVAAESLSGRQQVCKRAEWN